MPIDALILQADAPDRWEKALYAFLAEKERRSGSLRTVQSYSRMLRYFFGKLAKPPDEVRPADVLAYAHGVGLSGKEPSATTIGARIACVSSFWRVGCRAGSCSARCRASSPRATRWWDSPARRSNRGLGRPCRPTPRGGRAGGCGGWPGPLTALGTDGYGRSGTREELRDFFEVDYRHIVLAALTTLAPHGQIEADIAQRAMLDLEMDDEKPDPAYA